MTGAPTALLMPGCGCCDNAVPDAAPAAFTITTIEGAELRFRLCAECGKRYKGRFGRKLRREFRAALLARLAAITRDINEKRASALPVRS